MNKNDRAPFGWDDKSYDPINHPAQFQTTDPTVSTYANPTSVAYMRKMWPTGATTTARNSNYVANASSGGNNYQFVTRGGHDISDKQHLMGRYSWWDNINLAADPLKNGVCAEGECTEHYRIHNFVLDDTYTLSSKMVLDVRLSYGRYGYQRVPLDPWTTSDYNQIGWTDQMAGLTEFPGPPVFVVSTWDSYNLFSGQGADSTIIDFQDTYRLAGTLTRFVGNHTFKFGAEYTIDKFNYAQTNTSSGLWNFKLDQTSNSADSTKELPGNGLDAASFFTGYAHDGSNWYDDLTASEIKYPAAYVTDDWRVSQKLTLHLGARWEEVGPFTERHDRISIFNPTATNDTLTAAAATTPATFTGTVPQGNVELANTTEHPNRYGINPDHMQFSPHIGVSYRLAPNTVINTGFGLFWLPNYLSTNGNSGWDPSTGFSTPYVYSTNGYTPTSNISQPYPVVSGNPSLILPPGHNQTLLQNYYLGNGFTMDESNSPYSYTTQWNFGVQQQLGKSTAIDVSYAGAAGIHIPVNNGSFSINVLPDKYLAGQATCTPQSNAGVDDGNCLADLLPNPYAGAMQSFASLNTQYLSRGQLTVPYPQYAGIGGVLPLSHSSYNAMEVKLTRRFAEGASINVAYTFSKLEANTDTLASWLEGGITGISNWNNMKGEKSLSSTTAPSRLTVAYVYDVPIGRGRAILPNINRVADEVIGGWGLQGLTTLMSGFPVGISENLSGRTGSTNNGSSRPDVVPGCNKKVGGSAVSKLHGWYNTACFTESPSFAWGNESRNDSTIKSAGIANWDLSIVKKFPITGDGRVNFQFRGEFYNLFNRVQFGGPNGTFDTTNQPAWVTSQANQPRVAQFALRINY
jgi:hypothetical protein